MKLTTTLSLCLLFGMSYFTNAQNLLQADFPAASSFVTNEAGNASQSVVALDANSTGIITGPSNCFMAETPSDNSGPYLVECSYTPSNVNFTFGYNATTDDIPWGVKSRNDGANIFTFFTLGKVDQDAGTHQKWKFEDIYMLTPAFNLSASESYTFSQVIQQPSKKNSVEVSIGLSIISGTPDSFDPSTLDAELANVSYPKKTKAPIGVDNLTVPTDGSYYFVIYMNNITGPENEICEATMRFYETLLSKNTPTNLSSLSASTLQVYPSPANNSITISQAKGKVSIYSITGSCVKTINDYNGGTMDISDLPQGTYILKTKTSTIKFIKL